MFKRSCIFIIGCLIISLLFIPRKVYADTIQKRFGGSDRYATSLSICKNNWNKSDYAVLVSGESFADALCATTLAKKFDAPIILTNGKVLSNDIKNELTRLNVRKVFIIGASGVISEDIERQIYEANIDCERISGNDRYDTSLKVAQYIGINNGIVIASGEDFPDILSIAPMAAIKGIPILLTDKHSLNDNIKSYIGNSVIEKCYVLGVDNTVSEDIAKCTSNYKILNGVDRYETNQKIIDEFSNDINFGSVYVATGEGFADALSGSAAAAKINSPIIFTDGNVLLLKTVLASKISSINEMRVLGGEEIMPDEGVQTLLSDKKIVRYTYDAEKVSRMLQNNFESDGRKIVFLTFDDGPSTTVTPQILDILKNNDVKATFFLLGSNIEANEESKKLVIRILQDGHAIGNHTYTHELKIIYPGNKVDSDKYMEEVRETNNAISSIIGEEFKTRITRMPGGYMSRKYYKDPNLDTFNSVLRENNMYSIDWNAYDGDAEGGRKNAEQLVQEVRNTVGNKEKVILLMHDTYGKEETAKALPEIIKFLKDYGYEFRTIK
ncbi:cell wall-binding repeat-containing protein [Clostridium thailandense]|uniref:cell wall-binding repeat-containing protein n=1 Tax=Clostridium thailandense TaxID=2794346 RepID=UPI003989394B